ncbi:hypothetical protein [Alkalihalobacillus sp. AL-G]|uniref:hypothetical protein n=1 Tax=Alkalihalobacillus sp. AL-G TaxID=2926399 RepID=UPI00272BB5DA|nr:hypothetical protein [Alkalihalobacillus sp. AL-G]WLD92589.1 hypothetical protein MOJ78_16450 [Alkalihalobacillus sp. AL-G]
MAKQILDYFVSVPASANNSLNRVVPASPANIKLAEFGLSIPDPTNLVELTATVGWTATLGNPVLLFKIFRGSQIIFSTIDETDINVANVKTQSFNAVDSNVPAGQRVYSLTVEQISDEPLINTASVTGPVTFTGLAIGD